MTPSAPPTWQEAVFQVLKRGQVRQVAYVPDAGHAHLIRRAIADPEIADVALTPEEEGVALVRRTLEIEPGNAFAHVALARGLMKLGRGAEAAEEVRRAIELDPASEMIRSMAAEAQGMPPAVP